MSHIIDLKSFADNRGSLIVLEKNIPFVIKRVYYIFDVPKNSVRGNHRHKKSQQVFICLRGSCCIFCDNGKSKNEFILNTNQQALFVAAEDWHNMKNFDKDTILLVLSSENYDPDDYISVPYIQDRP